MLELSRHALTLSTRRLNAWPARAWRALGILSTSGDPRARSGRTGLRRKAYTLVEKYYDFGVVFASVAVVLAVTMVVLSGWQLLGRLWDIEGQLEAEWLSRANGDQVDPAWDGMARRAVDQEAPGMASSSVSSSTTDASQAPNALVLTPLIPGVTIPLWHLLPLLLALLISQAIHEAGHALAAALSGVTPLSTGIALIWPGMPSAFVALPSSALAIFQSDLEGDSGGDDQDENPSSLPLQEQLRILAAGVWHNATTLLVLFISSRLVFGNTSTAQATSTSTETRMTALVMEYISTLSLALAILNMLPLWGLDGEPFVERLALVFLRRRRRAFRNASGQAQEQVVSLGPWNGYATAQSSNDDAIGAPSGGGGGRLWKHAHPQRGISTRAHENGNGKARHGAGAMRGRGTHEGSLKLSYAHADDDDLEQQGRRAHLLKNDGGSLPSTVPSLLNGGSASSRAIRLADEDDVDDPSRLDSPLATRAEEKMLRALRTRVRAVLGVTALGVLGGSVLLEVVLAFA